MWKILTVLLVLLSGCAGFNLRSPERWVENNTFYSTKSPSIAIKVAPQFLYKEKEEKSKIIRTASDGRIGHHPAGRSSELFSFFDTSGNKRILVKIESVGGKDWFVIPPDFRKADGMLVTDTETIEGIKFTTGIQLIVVKSSYRLAKVYAMLASDDTFFSLIYIADSTPGLINRSLKLLSEDDWKVIHDFNKEANESFSITSYNGTPQPAQTSE